MNYTRIVPRDLIDESLLLKCWARLVTLLETAAAPHHVVVRCNGQPFDIRQDQQSGGRYVSNVLLFINGKVCNVHQPRDSGHEWPLVLVKDDGSEIQIFEESGVFSIEMIEHIHGETAQ